MDYKGLREQIRQKHENARKAEEAYIDFLEWYDKSKNRLSALLSNVPIFGNSFLSSIEQEYQATRSKLEKGLSPGDSDTDEVLSQALSREAFGPRAMDIFQKCGILTYRDLVQKDERELAGYRGVGATTIRRIKNVLSEKGLSLGMSLNNP
jgi:DNA-directed RNA polymerase alpha subunit